MLPGSQFFGRQPLSFIGKLFDLQMTVSWNHQINANKINKLEQLKQDNA